MVRVAKAGKAAAILAVLSFFVRLSFQSNATKNGVVTECTYIDIGGIGFGAAAVITGIITLAKGGSQSRKGLVLAVGAVAMVVGGFNVARGTGAFHDCGANERSAAASTAARNSRRDETAEMVREQEAKRSREQSEEREEPTADEVDRTAISAAKRKYDYKIGSPVTHELTLKTLEGQLIKYTVPRGWSETGSSRPATDGREYFPNLKEDSGAAELQISISFRFPEPDQAKVELMESYDDVEILGSVDVGGNPGTMFTYTQDDGSRIIEVVARQGSTQTDGKPGIVIRAVTLPENVDALRTHVENIAESVQLI